MEHTNLLAEAMKKSNEQIEQLRNETAQSEYDRKPPGIITQQSLASEFCKKLYKEIQEFDSALDSENEVAVRLVNFGETVQFGIESLGYSNPYLIIFDGHTPDGSYVQLIQHVNQISMLLLAEKRLRPEQPKHPIGFRQEG